MYNFTSFRYYLKSMRPFFKDFSEWYFTKNALPYWGILFLDCIGITLSYIVTILFVDMSGTTTMFDNGYLPITYGFLVSLFVYCLFFRLLHTYSGVIRYSNFKDLQNVVLSVFFASCLNILISLILIRLDVTCIIMFKPLGFFMMFILSSLGLIFMRMLVRMVFEKTRSVDSAKGVFIYGVLEGGISLAKSLLNHDIKVFELKGFISPSGDFVGQSLLNVQPVSLISAFITTSP